MVEVSSGWGSGNDDARLQSVRSPGYMHMRTEMQGAGAAAAADQMMDCPTDVPILIMLDITRAFIIVDTASQEL